MMHEGVEFKIRRDGNEPWLWVYEFFLGHKTIAGRAETSLPEMAIRRAENRIRREIAIYLKKFDT